MPRRRQTASGPARRAGSRQKGEDGPRPHAGDTDSICSREGHVRGLGRKRRDVHLHRRGALQEDPALGAHRSALPPRHREQTGVWTRGAVPANPPGLSGSEEGGGKRRAGARGQLPSLPSSTVCVTTRRGEAGRTPSPQAQGKPVALSPDRPVLLGLPAHGIRAPAVPSLPFPGEDSDTMGRTTRTWDNLGTRLASESALHLPHRKPPKDPLERGRVRTAV